MKSTFNNQNTSSLYRLKVMISLILAIFVMSSASWAEDYYVDAGKGNDVNPGTLSSPWRTLNKANSTLKAGDTVIIRGGDYIGQQIAPNNSGTANNRITYKNYGTEVVTIKDTDTPILLNNRQYITITGAADQNIIITNCDKYLTMSNGHYNHFAYLTISNMRNYERFEGFMIGPNASYNWVHHCTISGYGEYTATADRGDMVYVGDEPNPGDTHHNLVEDNHFHSGGHNVFSVNGHHNVVRNNYFHNEEWKNGYGGRIGVVKAGTADGLWNLIDGNRWCFTGMPPDNTFSPALKFHSNDNIVRKNMFYSVKGPGVQLATLDPSVAPLVDNNYIFHNVFFYNGLGSAKMAISFNNGPIKGTVIKNNIFHQIVGNNIEFNGKNVAADNTIVSNWEAGDPLFVDANTDKLDPLNRDYPNFNLQSKSSCIDSAAFLTSTTTSGNGNQIPVKDAHYFVDGFGIIEGDLIQLENQSITARITQIDYNKNVLTLDRNLSWSANQGISLQFNGSAPDLGAFESGDAAGETLSPPLNLKIVQ